jgi:hypothetical protein
MTKEKDDRDRSDWMVFQEDVLDVLRQYEGFMDFSERVGSLRDDSRPDFVARISREDKKEIWVVDAKRKPELDSEDYSRMRKYLEMLESNPIDIGLEMGEISEYETRGVFVTSSGDLQLEEFEQVKFSGLHQFLQRELVYTDTEKVVRDVAKMMERKELSQSQARLLFRSLKPFDRSRERALEVLEELETDYVGLELDEAPFDQELPVEAVLRHENRGKVFMIDVPYSRKELERVPEKVEEVKKALKDAEEEVYFAALDTFKTGSQHPHVYGIEDLSEEIRKTASVLSPVEVAEIFEPKIETEREWRDGHLKVSDRRDLGFSMRIATGDDVNYRIEVEPGRKVLESIKERKINTRNSLGEIKNGKMEIEFSVEEGLEIQHDSTHETLSGFRDTVKAVYSSSVNPVLSKKVKATVE